MSTKSTIIDWLGLEMYEETTEPQSVFGKFVGFNIYFIIDNPGFKRFTIQDEYLILEVDLSKHLNLPNELKFWVGDIIKIEQDEDDLLIIFNGGTETAKHLREKNYSFFTR